MSGLVGVRSGVVALATLFAALVACVPHPDGEDGHLLQASTTTDAGLATDASAASDAGLDAPSVADAGADAGWTIDAGSDLGVAARHSNTGPCKCYRPPGAATPHITRSFRDTKSGDVRTCPRDAGCGPFDGSAGLDPTCVVDAHGSGFSTRFTCSF